MSSSIPSRPRGAYAVAVGSAIIVNLAAAGVAGAQSFQSSGTDFSPAASNGQVVTNAHNDATGADTANVRVSAYAFGADPEDPYFTQDPGFNAPANSGLPAGSTLGFDVLDSLKYWNGTGAVALGTPAAGETVRYTFGSSSRTLSATSGPQSGFNLGAVASNGALHKHLNAFLQDGSGNFTPDASPTRGIYVTQLRLNDTGLTSSAAIFNVYSDGASQSSVDRAKFYLRNNFAAGSNILGNQTSLIGLSAQPGEANLATGGQVTITTTAGGGYASEVDDLTANANKGSVALSTALPSDQRVLALLYLNGASTDIASLVGHLDVPEAYDAASVNAPATDPLYADIQRLKMLYPGFSAVAAFTPTANDTAFTWDFSADQSVLMDKLAFVPESALAVPEPGTLAVAGVGGLLALRRRRR